MTCDCDYGSIEYLAFCNTGFEDFEDFPPHAVIQLEDCQVRTEIQFS